MNKEKKQYKVSILDEQYTIVSDEAPDIFLECVEYVDSLMREMTEKSRISDGKKIAVLVALQAVSALKHSHREHNEDAARLSDLMHQIDSVIQDD